MNIKSLGLLLVMVVGLQACTESTPPQLFSKLKFEEARQASLDQDKFLLVDGTAVWCGPCKMMDTTTWVDPQIISWIDERVIAIQLDVDEDPDDAQMLEINAMPTIIVFKDGEELNRFIGYRDADELLAWLDGLLETPSGNDGLDETTGEGVDEEVGVAGE
ncbi:MAG: thioredoxin family protein [Planctomycetota bacterium]|nr:thioredoxin family protein [Planctomycetota bacterium]